MARQDFGGFFINCYGGFCRLHCAVSTPCEFYPGHGCWFLGQRTGLGKRTMNVNVNEKVIRYPTSACRTIRKIERGMRQGSE